jgi:hypothetical protein
MHPSLEVGGKHLPKEAGNEMRKTAASAMLAIAER